ncbi:MAG: tryptophan synthase subunit alpha, partial [Coriobacteriia bacterium]|nr:tryptophan synthase subunit alpha [Coriobacteriia bacterium]
MADVSPQSATGLAPAFAKGHPALVVYLMAGYPDAERSLAAMRAAAASGADLIELGVPYSDALADGPVIARAAGEAMRSNPGGFGLAEAIDLAAAFIADPGVDEPPPVALMTYINPMLRLGYTETAARMRVAGIVGVIVPDMPPDVAASWLCSSSGMDTVFLAAPTSTPGRLAKVGELSSGFVYAVSTTGITGERDHLSATIPGLVTRIRAHTTLPVAVGFGISTPEQAAEIAAFADGVIVGSACVKRQGDAGELGRFVS